MTAQILQSSLQVRFCSFTMQDSYKNIRPETILIFASDSLRLEYPFLVGFEKFRPASGHTYRVGDTRRERYLRRHPKRQGISVEEDFKMQHDIYSLGVCLLEIGKWTSL